MYVSVLLKEDQKWADEEMEAHREEVRKKDKSFKFEVPRSTAWTEREAAWKDDADRGEEKREGNYNAK